MSSTAQPITPARFSAALPSLPISTLHETAAQTRNSLAHLRSSNVELRPHADEGDAVCKEAIEENEVVIERMQRRMEMLKAEVEGRGTKWVEDEDVDGQNGVAQTNGDYTDNGRVEPSNGSVEPSNGSSTNSGATSSRNGGLTDDELRRRLEERMSDLEGDEDGMHL